MFDVITFGSAAWDIALNLPKTRIKKETNLIVDKGIFFNLGSKIDIANINTNFGGGGINTATTFSYQGLKTAYCGAVGDDIGGREILNYLKKARINSSLVQVALEKKTNTSVILIPSNQDRTILVYRGASDCLQEKDLDWKKLNSKWFFLAPLSGKLSLITEKILEYAKSKNIKCAVNLGSTQLSFSKPKLKAILDKTDILLMNLEEASVLTKINYSDERKIIKEVKKMCNGIVVVTDGEYGVSVICGDKIYKAAGKKIKPVDTTGAGDAFASAFVSALIRDEHDIERALKLGITNAKHCLLEMGSTNGLLTKKENNLVEKEEISIEIFDL
ncbi:carbohydrate kinase family protein [bacterium]|jgi:sugar/nucleoside kinase (ribokinase family)|nr:carbohydrate kinase family protein [bacterium]